MTAPITWAEASAPVYWSNIGIDWNSPAKSNSSSFAVSGGYTSTHLNIVAGSVTFAVNASETSSASTTFPVSITLALDGGYTGLGGFTFPESVSLDLNADYTQVNSATYPNSISLGVSNDYISNINHGESISLSLTNRLILGQFFQDSITMTVNGDATTDNEFLWDDVSDVSTTWTTVEYPN